jgi:hypothetical protein
MKKRCFVTSYREHIINYIYISLLGFELKALCLLGRCSTLEPCPQCLFILVIFQIGCFIYAQVSLKPRSSYLWLFMAGILDVKHHTSKMLTFLCGLASNSNPSYLYLLNSWDYGYEPPYLACNLIFLKIKKYRGFNSLCSMQSISGGNT